MYLMVAEQLAQLRIEDDFNIASLVDNGTGDTIVLLLLII